MNRPVEQSIKQYNQQGTYSYRERLVGFFVFFGFILLLFFVFISVNNQHLFEKRVKFYIDVKSSEGISPDSVVKALGAEVGRVASLELARDHKIRVTIEVYEQQRKFIRTGATALVNRLTNIGSAQIEIKSELIDAPILAAGSIIPVEETPSLNELLLGMASIIHSVNNKDLFSQVENILPKVEQTFANIHEIIAQIATGHGVLGAAVFDQKVEKELKVVVKSGAEILAEAEGIISIAKKRLIQLEPVLADAQYMVKDMRGASKNLPGMVRQLQGIIEQASTAIALVNAELQEIPGVAIDAKRTLSKADKLVDSVQNTWPLSEDDLEEKPIQLIPPHSHYE